MTILDPLTGVRVTVTVPAKPQRPKPSRMAQDGLSGLSGGLCLPRTRNAASGHASQSDASGAECGFTGESPI